MTEAPHRIIWIQGRVGAGKTAMALALQALHGGIVINGDDWIEIMAPARVGKRPKGSTSPAAKRLQLGNNERIARLAVVLRRQTRVYVAVVSPNDGVRAAIDKVCAPFWVWVDRPGALGAGAWQAPAPAYLDLVAGRYGESIDEGVARIAEAMGLS